MNEVINLLLELQELVNQGYDVDDAKLDLAMRTLQSTHDNNIDSSNFLTRPQKRRRKELYGDCVKAMKKYVKLSLQDDQEIRNYISKQK